MLNCFKLLQLPTPTIDHATKLNESGVSGLRTDIAVGVHIFPYEIITEKFAFIQTQY